MIEEKRMKILIDDNLNNYIKSLVNIRGSQENSLAILWTSCTYLHGELDTNEFISNSSWVMVNYNYDIR